MDDTAHSTSKLTTERLRLRPLIAADAARLELLFTDSEVRLYLGGPLDIESARQKAQAIATRWGWFAVIEQSTGDAIGFVGFDNGRQVWEVSYMLHRTAWGRGYGQEATRAAIEWFIEQMPGESIIAVTQLANVGSRRMLESLGAEMEHQFDEFGATQVQYRFPVPMPS